MCCYNTSPNFYHHYFSIYYFCTIKCYNSFNAIIKLIVVEDYDERLFKLTFFKCKYTKINFR